MHKILSRIPGSPPPCALLALGAILIGTICGSVFAADEKAAGSNVAQGPRQNFSPKKKARPPAEAPPVVTRKNKVSASQSKKEIASPLAPLEARNDDTTRTQNFTPRKKEARAVPVKQAPPPAPEIQKTKELVEEKEKKKEKEEVRPTPSPEVMAPKRWAVPKPESPIIIAAREETKRIAVARLEKKREFLTKGKRYYDEKHYGAALELWEQALEFDPHNPLIKKLVKRAQRRLGLKMRENLISGALVTISDATPHPMTVDECIKVAVKNNLALRVADKNVKLAEMRIWEARRNLLPKLSVTYEESDGKVSGRRYTGRKQFFEGQQPVFHGGELYFIMKQAETNYEIVKADYQRTRNDLVLQVKKGYYTFTKSKRNLTLQQELKDEVDQIGERVGKAYDEGVLAKLEWLNVTSQQSQVGFQYVSAKGDAAIAELILKQAMNIEPDEDLEIVEPKLEFKRIDVDYRRSLALALMNRPEIRVNSMMVDYYMYEQKVSGAKFFPKIDFMGNWGLAKEEVASEDRLGPTSGTTYDPDQKLQQQWYAGFKASMPFLGNTVETSVAREHWVPVVSAFQGTESETRTYKVNLLDNLKTFSDKALANIDYDRARQEYNKSRQDITLEVREGCFNFEKVSLQVQTADAKLKFQEADTEAMRIRRQMGDMEDSSLIESLIKRAQERYGHVQTLTEYYVAIATINKAIGLEGYFSVEQDGKSPESIEQDNSR